MSESPLLHAPAIPVTSITAASSLRAHWPEYLMESAELGFFMLSACFFTTLLEHPASAARHMLPSALLRHAISGLAMAVTLLLLIHSAWGKRSGAHMNPAMTLMFLRLGKIEPWDGLFYACSQFAGGLAGVAVSSLVIGSALAHPEVNFAITEPGMWGAGAAFVAELLISFLLAVAVLVASNDKRLSRFTPYFAATLVAAYITFEAPFFRDEHEPGAHVILGHSSARLSRTLDLFHGPASRDAHRCRVLPANAFRAGNGFPVQPHIPLADVSERPVHRFAHKVPFIPRLEFDHRKELSIGLVRGFLIVYRKIGRQRESGSFLELRFARRPQVRLPPHRLRENE